MLQERVYADQKLTSFNFIQTPVGADTIRLTGPLSIRQKDLYSPGSIKRVINFDNLASKLTQQSLLSYLQQSEAYNTTC